MVKVARPRWLPALVIAPAILAAGCGASEPRPVLLETTQVIPSAGLPASLALQGANNNLDVVAHDGRVYLAFRTAPTHFASPATVIHVISSEDEIHWEHEASWNRETDLREPRFLSFDGKLFLYFALLGTNSLDFEPKGMVVSELQSRGRWSEPEPCYLPGFIPWRTKVLGGRPYLIAYVGGENIYDMNGRPLEIHWLTTTDGRAWTPVIPGQPIVERGGGSETDFVFQDDGSLVAVTRNEAGDQDGFGSKICRAEPGALGEWRCAADRKKYDSPLVFRHEDAIYLIGRRNLTGGGYYDLQRTELSPVDQSITYALDYWEHRKRCALWRVDPVALSVAHVLDLPSRGDTCFPGLLPLGDGRYAIYNYSSPIDGPDTGWLEGQLAPTNIYRSVLEFTR